MPKRNGSPDSLNDFFSEPNTRNDGEKKKARESEMPASSGVGALIRGQPIVASRQAPTETKPTANSRTIPMTTNDKNAPTSQPSKSHGVESSPRKEYESDFDNDTNRDGKKKHNSLPPSKQGHQHSTRRGSDSEVKTSYTVTNENTPRKEQLLPYLRPKNRRRGFTKEPPPKPTKSEAEQRLSSAQDEKLKDLRSRISLVRRQLEQEQTESKTLRVIHRREEKYLKNFEDQEHSAQKVAQEFKHEIGRVKDKIDDEKEVKMQLQKDSDEQDEQLRHLTKRTKFYEKLVAHEDEYEEYETLRDKLKEMDKQMKKCQEKITKQEKQIDNLEQNHRQEMTQHLAKRRELKHDIQDQSKKYNDMLLKFEHKSRQVDTMHIYIQRGGRRPSDSSSVNLAKSRSFQEIRDISPQFREKMLDYDRKRRETEKDKPKPPPLPLTPPPKPPRKKYVPSIDLKPKKKVKLEEKKKSPEPPPVVEPVREKLPARRLSTPKSYDQETSESEEEIVMEPVHVRHRSPSPSPPPRIAVAPPKPRSPSPPPKSVFKPPEIPPPPPKPIATRDFDSKWMNIFSNDQREESTKDQLLSKLATDEPKDRKPRTSMFTYEPPTTTTQKKPAPRVVTSIYDFDQAVINLHNGKPVTAQPTTSKPSDDPFETSSNNLATRPAQRLDVRENSFTKAPAKATTFESRFTLPKIDSSTSTSTKANSKQTPSSNDLLQRPRVVTNAPKSNPNRIVTEEIEDFFL